MKESSLPTMVHPMAAGYALPYCALSAFLVKMAPSLYVVECVGKIYKRLSVIYIIVIHCVCVCGVTDNMGHIVTWALIALPTPWKSGHII